MVSYAVGCDSKVVHTLQQVQVHLCLHAFEGLLCLQVITSRCIQAMCHSL